MASSFSSQIPVIIWLIQVLQPRTVLDVGKGFGKYGFLAHEYLGIDAAQRPDPSRTLAEQSRIVLDAVECNSDYLWPHIPQFYRKVYSGRIEDLWTQLPSYDLVLMCDVIEHLAKDDGLRVARHFLGSGSALIVSTPRDFFQQALYKSPDERHLSHWTPTDFRPLAAWMDWQTIDAGRVYVLSQRKVDIRGFGRSPMKRLRRVARAVCNELLA